MKQEKLIRIAYRPDKTIEIMSDFDKNKTRDKLIFIGNVLEEESGAGIIFIRYKK